MKINIFKAKIIALLENPRSIDSLFVCFKGEITKIWISQTLSELMLLNIITRQKMIGKRTYIYHVTNKMFLEWASEVLARNKTMNFEVTSQ